MAEMYFPFLSVDGDRAYSDLEFATYYASLFTNGVVATVEEQLRVQETAEPGMRVNVHPGAMFTQGRLYLSTEPITVNVTPGSSTADRTDLIVVQLDMLERKMKLLYKQGTTSLRRDENYWEMQLARIEVPRNATAVFNSHIRDTRAEAAVCGYSILRGGLNVEGVEQQYRSLLQQAFDEFNQSANENQENLEQLLTDQQTLFQTWLTGLQNQLDENQAGNLQNQLDKLTANNEVIEIEHGLGYYPTVSVLYWEYGLGTVPLEEQPADVPWDGTPPETIPFKVYHDSWNKLRVSVPVDKSMTSPTVSETEPNVFILHTGVKSMEITVGGN